MYSWNGKFTNNINRLEIMQFLINVILQFYVMQGTTILHTFVPYKELKRYECRQCTLANAQGNAGILHFVIAS